MTIGEAEKTTPSSPESESRSRTQMGLPCIAGDVSLDEMLNERREQAQEARLRTLRDRQARKRERDRLREQEHRHVEGEARSRRFWTEVASEEGLVNEDER